MEVLIIYLNGERNGKGKEYDEIGNLIYEGEYLKKKKKGKGKEYDYYGNIIFEGEYLNRKKYKTKQGDKIINIEEGPNLNKEIIKKYYHYKGSLIYEGIYLNGKRLNGKGKEYFYNNSGNKIDYKDKLILKVNIYMIIEKKEKNRVIYEGETIYFTQKLMVKDMI